MKKTISLILIFCIMLTFSLSAVANTDVDDISNGLSREIIIKLENYVSIVDGLLYFDISQARHDGNYSGKELGKMQVIIAHMNQLIRSGDLTVGISHGENEIGIKSWGPGPITETTRMTFCLSKNEVRNAITEINNNEAAGLKNLLITGAASLLGFSALFGVVTTIGGIQYATAEYFLGSGSDLKNTLEYRVQYMNENQYLVVNMSMANEWRSISSWLNKDMPHKVYMLYVVNSWITNYKVNGAELLNYL